MAGLGQNPQESHDEHISISHGGHDELNWHPVGPTIASHVRNRDARRQQNEDAAKFGHIFIHMNANDSN